MLILLLINPVGDLVEGYPNQFKVADEVSVEHGTPRIPKYLQDFILNLPYDIYI